MPPARAPQQICHVGAGARLCVGLSQRLVGFPSAVAALAISILVFEVRFATLRETPDADAAKNAYSQERFLKRISVQRSKCRHSAKCEMVVDLLFPLLFHAIAKAHEVSQPRALAESQTHEYAKDRQCFEPARQRPAQSHADTTVEATAGVHNDPAPIPIFEQAEANSGHH